MSWGEIFSSYSDTSYSLYKKKLFYPTDPYILFILLQSI